MVRKLSIQKKAKSNKQKLLVKFRTCLGWRTTRVSIVSPHVSNMHK
jgi:hypothetical protein